MDILALSKSLVFGVTAGCLCMTDLASRGSTIIWTNTSGGNWSSAINWNPNQVPVSSDDAVITNAGNYTVTLDANATVNSLALGGSSGTQSFAQNGNTLTINQSGSIGLHGIFNIAGGTIGGSGNLTIGGVLNWSGGTAASVVTVATNGQLNFTGTGTKYLRNVLTNAGTVTWLNGGIQVYNYAPYGYYGAVENLPGALWDIQCNQTLANSYSGPADFRNRGTVQKSAGTGTSTFSIPFNNAGTITAQTGTIAFSGGGIAGGNV